MKKIIIYFLTIIIVSCNQIGTEKNDLINKTDLIKEKLALKENEVSHIQDKEESKTQDEIILDIKEKFRTINQNISSYKKVTKDLMGESIEGGDIEVYFKKEELKKIVAPHYGEMGKSIREYYFWNNDLFFVFTQEYAYDKPMYMENSSVNRIDENRYYFYNEKLIRWLDPNKEKVVNSKFSKKEAEILQNTKKLREKIN